MQGTMALFPPGGKVSLVSTKGKVPTQGTLPLVRPMVRVFSACGSWPHLICPYKAADRRAVGTGIRNQVGDAGITGLRVEQAPPLRGLANGGCKLDLRSAHLLLKILEELVERQLYRTFDNHIRGSGDFAFHLSVCIVVNSSALGVIGQIYRAGGFD